MTELFNTYVAINQTQKHEQKKARIIKLAPQDRYTGIYCKYAIRATGIAILKYYRYLQYAHDTMVLEYSSTRVLIGYSSTMW